MARFSGKVGYGESQEIPANSGIWEDVIVESSTLYGNVIRNTRRLENGDSLNDNITVGNSISLVADEKAKQDFMLIKYIWWQGKAWTVDSVEVQHPRLIFSLGKIYHGPFPEVTP